MAKIQYNTKKLRVNTPPTSEELFSFNDANEIKASVNFLYDNPSTPDLSKLIKLQQLDESYGQQTGNIAINGNMLGDSANFQYINLVEGAIINKADFSGAQPIIGFAQLLPNELTFNDNDYNTGYSGDAVYGSGLMSLRVNGKGKFTLSKLGAIDNEVDIKIPDASGTLARIEDLPAPIDLSEFLKNYNTGDDVLNLSNIALDMKSVQGQVHIDSTSIVILAANGNDVHLSQNGLGFNKNNGETSFNADERSLILKPTWNRSATIKIDETGSPSHFEYTLPKKNGILATLGDLPAPVDTSNFATRNELNQKTNKTESFENNGSLTYFTANISDGFGFSKSNDQYEGNTSTYQTTRSFQVSTEKPTVGNGQLNRGTSLQLAQYGDGLYFNQNTVGKNNAFRLQMPVYNTSSNTNAIVAFPPMVEDGTIMVLSDNQNPPASQTAAGVKGEVRIIGNFKYECVSTNYWVRTPVQGVW